MAHSRETQTHSPQLPVGTALPHSEISASPGARVALDLTPGLCGQPSPHLPEVTALTRTRPLLFRVVLTGAVPLTPSQTHPQNRNARDRAGWMRCSLRSPVEEMLTRKQRFYVSAEFGLGFTLSLISNIKCSSCCHPHLRKWINVGSGGLPALI